MSGVATRPDRKMRDKNIAERYPQVVEELKKELEKWEAQIKQPMWPCRDATGEWVVDDVGLKICV